MAKISALPDIAAPTGDETVVVLDAGVAKRTTVTKLLAPKRTAFDANATAKTDALNAVFANASGTINATASALSQSVARPLGSALVAGNVTSGDYVAVFADPIVGLPKKLRRMPYYARIAKRIRLFKQDTVGGQRIQRGPDHFYTTIVGSNVLTAADIPTLRLGPGQTIGFGDADGVFGNDTTQPADGLGFYTAPGGNGSRLGALAGPYTNQQLQVGFDFEVDPDAASAPRIVGKAATPTAGNATCNAGLWLIFVDPAQREEYIKAIPLYATAAETLNLAVWDGASGVQIATYAVPIVPGFQTLTPTGNPSNVNPLGIIPVKPGQVVALRSGSIASMTGINGTRFSYVGSAATSFNPNDNGSAQNTQELQIQFQMEALSDSAASLDTRVKSNSSTRAPITPTARKMRARLARVGVIVVLADSIGAAAFYPSSETKHYLNLLQAAVVGDVDPNSRIGVSDFGLAATYGLTLAGSTPLVDTGPIGHAVQINPGGSVSFTGNFATVAYHYNQAVGAGTLTLTRTGSAAAVDAFSTAGAVSPDEFRQVPTGYGSSDTYTLTASGGPVVLTALHRIGARTSDMRSPLFHRMAFQGQSTSNFTSDQRLASIIKQAQSLCAPGTVPMIIEALGHNDAINNASKNTPDQFYANLCRIYARLQAGGIYTTSLGMIRPDPVKWPVKTAGATYDEFLAKKVAAWELYGVPGLALDGYDFANAGLTSTGDGQGGLHPNDPGYALIAQLLLSFITGAECAGIAAQPARRGRIDVIVSGVPTLLAMGGSMARRADGVPGAMLYLNQGGETFSSSWAAVA